MEVVIISYECAGCGNRYQAKISKGAQACGSVETGKDRICLKCGCRMYEMVTVQQDGE